MKKSLKKDFAKLIESKRVNLLKKVGKAGKSLDELSCAIDELEDDEIDPLKLLSDTISNLVGDFSEKDLKKGLKQFSEIANRAHGSEDHSYYILAYLLSEAIRQGKVEMFLSKDGHWEDGSDDLQEIPIEHCISVGNRITFSGFDPRKNAADDNDMYTLDFYINENSKKKKSK